MTVEPMTDAMISLHEDIAGGIIAEGAAGIVGAERSYPAEAVLSLIARIRSSEARLDAERSRADAAEAERDAAQCLLKAGRHSFNDLDPRGKTIIDFMSVWLDQAERARARLTAERDAALARAMPEWRYLATWDEVNTVEARHNDEPAPGLYVVWKPGWPYPSAASVQFGVFATDEESPAPDDYLLGAWVVGPLSLPDLPIPPTED